MTQALGSPHKAVCVRRIVETTVTLQETEHFLQIKSVPSKRASSLRGQIDFDTFDSSIMDVGSSVKGPSSSHKDNTIINGKPGDSAEKVLPDAQIAGSGSPTDGPHVKTIKLGSEMSLNESHDGDEGYTSAILDENGEKAGSSESLNAKVNGNYEKGAEKVKTIKEETGKETEKQVSDYKTLLAESDKDRRSETTKDIDFSNINEGKIMIAVEKSEVLTRKVKKEAEDVSDDNPEKDEQKEGGEQRDVTGDKVVSEERDVVSEVYTGGEDGGRIHGSQASHSGPGDMAHNTDIATGGTAQVLSTTYRHHHDEEHTDTYEIDDEEEDEDDDGEYIETADLQDISTQTIDDMDDMPTIKEEDEEGADEAITDNNIDTNIIAGDSKENRQDRDSDNSDEKGDLGNDIDIDSEKTEGKDQMIQDMNEQGNNEGNISKQNIQSLENKTDIDVTETHTHKQTESKEYSQILNSDERYDDKGTGGENVKTEPGIDSEENKYEVDGRSQTEAMKNKEADSENIDNESTDEIAEVKAEDDTSGYTSATDKKVNLDDSDRSDLDDVMGLMHACAQDGVGSPPRVNERDHYSIKPWVVMNKGHTDKLAHKQSDGKAVERMSSDDYNEDATGHADPTSGAFMSASKSSERPANLAIGDRSPASDLIHNENHAENGNSQEHSKRNVTSENVIVNVVVVENDIKTEYTHQKKTVVKVNKVERRITEMGVERGIEVGDSSAQDKRGAEEDTLVEAASHVQVIQTNGGVNGTLDKTHGPIEIATDALDSHVKRAPEHSGGNDNIQEQKDGEVGEKGEGDSDDEKNTKKGGHGEDGKEEGGKVTDDSDVDDSTMDMTDYYNQSDKKEAVVENEAVGGEANHKADMGDRDRQADSDDEAALQVLREAIHRKTDLIGSRRKRRGYALEKKASRKARGGGDRDEVEGRTIPVIDDMKLLYSTDSNLPESRASMTMLGPHVRPLTGLRPGRSLLIEGIINKPANGICISLQSTETQPPSKCDVVLQCSFSFEDKSILCNTYCHETWGASEKCNKKFPFSKGKKFAVKIVADAHNYKLYANDTFLMDYDHRIPPDRVKYLRLDGDAIYNNIECPYMLDLPFILGVPHGFRHLSSVVVDGFVWKKANSFEINFLCGEKNKETQASFIIKFKYLPDLKTKIEMVSLYNDKKGEDGLVEGDLGIEPGKDIKVKILVQESNFSLEVDNYHLADYEHNVPIEKLDHVLVDGDISLYSCRFQRPPRRRRSSMRKVAALNDDCCACHCSIT